MEQILVSAQGGFRYIVEWGILALESFGVFVLLATSVKALISWIRRESDVRLELAEGILLALGFKMGGEVLHTVIASETHELVAIFAVILLRGVLAGMLTLEIRSEERKIHRL